MTPYGNRRKLWGETEACIDSILVKVRQLHGIADQFARIGFDDGAITARRCADVVQDACDAAAHECEIENIMANAELDAIFPPTACSALIYTDNDGRRSVFMDDEE